MSGNHCYLTRGWVPHTNTQDKLTYIILNGFICNLISGLIKPISFRGHFSSISLHRGPFSDFNGLSLSCYRPISTPPSLAATLLKFPFKLTTWIFLLFTVLAYSCLHRNYFPAVSHIEQNTCRCNSSFSWETRNSTGDVTNGYGERSEPLPVSPLLLVDRIGFD